MIDAQLPGQWRTYATSFTITNGTQAKVLADVTPPQVVASISGETALPGETSVRQRILTGGQRIFDGSISSSETATARAMFIYLGVQTTLYANMGTVTVTNTTNNTITRTLGSFVTDGYQVGDVIMVFGSSASNNNGVVSYVTTVVSGTLTLNGVTLPSATTEAAGFRIVRVSLRTIRNIPFGAGFAAAGTTPAVQLLGGSQDPAAFAAPDTGLVLDQNGMLIVGMQAAVSALNIKVDVHALGALY